jgi:hypothetical protein
MKIRLVIFIALAGILTFFWVVRCTGPDPSIADVRLIEPEAQDRPYQVEATIRNRNGQRGQVEVNVSLTDTDTGDIFQESLDVSFEGEESVVIVSEIQAPPASYEVEVKASYPPQ